MNCIEINISHICINLYQKSSFLYKISGIKPRNLPKLEKTRNPNFIYAFVKFLNTTTKVLILI